MAQAPGTPTKDMKECYPGTPIVGSPGREKKASEVGASDTKITEVKLCDVSLIAFSTNNKRISVKGTVEKTATLGRMTGTPGKIVEFFSVNMVDDVSSISCIIAFMFTGDTTQQGARVCVCRKLQVVFDVYGRIKSTS